MIRHFPYKSCMDVYGCVLSSMMANRDEHFFRPMSGEQVDLGKTITVNSARPDFSTRKFWPPNIPQKAFLISKFSTNTSAPSYSGLTLNQLFHRQEAEKKRVNSQRVLEVFFVKPQRNQSLTTQSRV